MKHYSVQDINACTLKGWNDVMAKSSSDAVLKLFGVKAKRSGDFVVDYCVIPFVYIDGRKIQNGKRVFLKKIKKEEQQ